MLAREIDYKMELCDLDDTYGEKDPRDTTRGSPTVPSSSKGGIWFQHISAKNHSTSAQVTEEKKVSASPWIALPPRKMRLRKGERG